MSVRQAISMWLNEKEFVCMCKCVYIASLRSKVECIFLDLIAYLQFFTVDQVIRNGRPSIISFNSRYYKYQTQRGGVCLEFGLFESNRSKTTLIFLCYEWLYARIAFH